MQNRQSLKSKKSFPVSKSRLDNRLLPSSSKPSKVRQSPSPRHRISPTKLFVATENLKCVDLFSTLSNVNSNPEMPASSSETSSILVDEKYINDALRDFQPGKSEIRMVSLESITVPSVCEQGIQTEKPSTPRTEFAVITTTAFGPKNRVRLPLSSHSSDIRALLSTRLRSDQGLRKTEGLMLSPRPQSSTSRYSIVSAGLETTPGLIHSHDRMKAMKIPFGLALDFRPQTRRKRSDCTVPSNTKKRTMEGAALLLASKGERTIRMSKTGQLLRCYTYDKDL